MTPSGDANYYSGIKTVCQCLLKKNRKILQFYNRDKGLKTLNLTEKYKK